MRNLRCDDSCWSEIWDFLQRLEPRFEAVRSPEEERQGL